MQPKKWYWLEDDNFIHKNFTTALFNSTLTLRLSLLHIFVKRKKMVTDYFYFSIVAALLVAVAAFYFSPFDFSIEEEHD